MTKELLQQALDALCLYLTAGHGNSTDFEKQGVAYDKAKECLAAHRTAIAQPASMNKIVDDFRNQLDQLSQRNYDLRFENAGLSARLKAASTIAQPDVQPKETK